jgi:hypothetical protein
MLGDAPPSDTATCAETRAYIAENVPPPEFVKLAADREQTAKHLALRVLFNLEIPARLDGDPLRDLAVAAEIAGMLSQEASVHQADRIDRALSFAARPDIAMEAAVMIGASILRGNPAQMPEWQARGYRGLRGRDACRRFMDRAGKYLPF